VLVAEGSACGKASNGFILTESCGNSLRVLITTIPYFRKRLQYLNCKFPSLRVSRYRLLKSNIRSLLASIEGYVTSIHIHRDRQHSIVTKHPSAQLAPVTPNQNHVITVTNKPSGVHADLKMQRMIGRLGAIMEPVGVQRRQTHRYKTDSTITEIGFGAVVVETWSDSGRRMYVVKEAPAGFGLHVATQELAILRRKLSILITCIWNPRLLLGFEFRIRLRCARIVLSKDFAHRAIQHGNITALKQLLISGTVTLNDITKHGNTLLHVSISSQ
jgi:hypothetical protein